MNILGFFSQKWLKWVYKVKQMTRNHHFMKKDRKNIKLTLQNDNFVKKYICEKWLKICLRKKVETHLNYIKKAKWNGKKPMKFSSI